MIFFFFFMIWVYNIFAAWPAECVLNYVEAYVITIYPRVVRSIFPSPIQKMKKKKEKKKENILLLSPLVLLIHNALLYSWLNVDVQFLRLCFGPGK